MSDKLCLEDGEKKGLRFLTIVNTMIFLVVVLLFAVGYLGNRVWQKTEERVRATIVETIAEAYPALYEHPQPQLIEVLSLKGEVVDWTDLIDAEAVVFSLNAGMTSGYCFHQRINVAHPEDKSTIPSTEWSKPDSNLFRVGLILHLIWSTRKNP